jgi:hypothetical protein
VVKVKEITGKSKGSKDSFEHYLLSVKTTYGYYVKKSISSKIKTIDTKRKVSKTKQLSKTSKTFYRW